MATTTFDLLNAIRGVASTDYVDRVPLATRTNITAVGNAITSYTATMNEFMDGLVNRIGKVIISSKMASNPLASFKKGMLPFGKDIEEIFVEMCSALPFNQATAETELYKRVVADPKSIFHRENRKDFYKTTISTDQLKAAFLNEAGIQDLVSRLIEALYSGDAFDEFVIFKNLLAAYSANYLTVTSPVITDAATAEKFIKAVRQVSLDMTFFDTTMNKAGVKTKSDKNDQMLILHKNVSAAIDVDVLAHAFNMDKETFQTNTIIVDDFGTMVDTLAILCDKEFPVVYDTKFELTSAYNAQGLYWNYFLHHWQLVSTSQFQNAVRFAYPAI